MSYADGEYRIPNPDKVMSYADGEYRKEGNWRNELLTDIVKTDVVTTEKPKIHHEQSQRGSRYIGTLLRDGHSCKEKMPAADFWAARCDGAWNGSLTRDEKALVS